MFGGLERTHARRWAVTASEGVTVVKLAASESVTVVELPASECVTVVKLEASESVTVVELAAFDSVTVVKPAVYGSVTAGVTLASPCENDVSSQNCTAAQLTTLAHHQQSQLAQHILTQRNSDKANEQEQELFQ